MVMVAWPRALRIIRSIHPPIDLFEDIADPRDWDALASLESKTNPRLHDLLGQLGRVPVDRRVGGPGSSYVMAPFIFASTDRPGRFTDGTYGVYSCGDSEEVAIREVAYHHGRAMAATNEGPGWTSQFRMLVGSLAVDLEDLRGRTDCHDPDSWTMPQAVGRQLRDAGAMGVLYNAVRCPGGLCAGLFWPHVTPIPVQGDHYDFHWDGAKVDRVYNRAAREELAL